TQTKKKYKAEEEKPTISPTRRSTRHQKEEIKEEIVYPDEEKNLSELAEISLEEQSEDDYEPADDAYDPPNEEPSSNSESELDLDEEFGIKKGKKTKRKTAKDSLETDNTLEAKPKRKYKKLTPEEREAKKNKSSSKQMKLCAEWDQFLADFGFVFKCKICDFVGKDFRDLKGHFRVAHDKPRGYAMCCDRIFYKKEVLVEHIHIHINPEHFKCKNCGMTFKASKSLEFVGPKDLDSHIKRMHEMISSTLCEQCGKVVQNSKMSAHRLEHQGKKPEMIECHLCGAKLRCDLNRHIEAMHSNSDEKHVCHVCGKESSNFYALRKHILYNHQMERKFECTICDKKFKQRYNLKEHMAVHTGESLYNCPHCEWRFKSSANMHTHIKRRHRAEWEENRKYRNYSKKHFKCKNCGMTFKASKSLEYHSIHTCKSINSEDVKKLFQCDECLKWFNSKFLLQRHKLSHMPLEERQWKCTVADCGKL
uniref:C2H2-type domain-containing protein n=1 Tax=Megaselia scalaris TaxID=36166 RepID=T1GBR1_MEGSC